MKKVSIVNLKKRINPCGNIGAKHNFFAHLFLLFMVFMKNSEIILIVILHYSTISISSYLKIISKF